MTANFTRPRAGTRSQKTPPVGTTGVPRPTIGIYHGDFGADGDVSSDLGDVDARFLACGQGPLPVPDHEDKLAVAAAGYQDATVDPCSRHIVAAASETGTGQYRSEYPRRTPRRCDRAVAAEIGPTFVAEIMESRDAALDQAGNAGPTPLRRPERREQRTVPTRSGPANRYLEALRPLVRTAIAVRPGLGSGRWRGLLVLDFEDPDFAVRDIHRVVLDRCGPGHRPAVFVGDPSL